MTDATKGRIQRFSMFLVPMLYIVVSGLISRSRGWYWEISPESAVAQVIVSGIITTIFSIAAAVVGLFVLYAVLVIIIGTPLFFRWLWTGRWESSGGDFQ